LNDWGCGANSGPAASDAIPATLPNRAARRRWKSLQRRMRAAPAACSHPWHAVGQEVDLHPPNGAGVVSARMVRRGAEERSLVFRQDRPTAEPADRALEALTRPRIAA
jgi:hypothetical protein